MCGVRARRETCADHALENFILRFSKSLRGHQACSAMFDAKRPRIRVMILLGLT